MLLLASTTVGQQDTTQAVASLTIVYHNQVVVSRQQSLVGMALSESASRHCERSEAISLLRHEGDCFVASLRRPLTAFRPAKGCSSQ